jgi:CheY-like chemotaxis protein
MWLEDKPNLVEGLANVMRRDDHAPVNVKLYESSEVAKKDIWAFKPDLVLVDLRLEQKIDGIAFIRHVRKQNPVLPVRVVSSFIRDYETQLKSLPNLTGVHDRLTLDGEVGMKFLRTAKIDAYVNSAARSLQISNLRLADLNNAPDYREFLRFHWRLFGKIAIEAIATQNLAWVAICGDDIVETGNGMETFPDDGELDRLDQKYQKAPFAYARPVISEESGAGLLLEQYPECQIKVHTWGKANFDTGTNQTLVSEDLCAGSVSGLQHNEHQGQRYEYGFRRESITLRCADSETVEDIGPFNMAVAVVFDWLESPWVAVNPDRSALLGRDIFKGRDISIQLSSTRNPGTVKMLIIPKQDQE